MAKPVLSIIMPAHNSESTIERALESIRQSSFADFECLVVDNSTSPRTKQVFFEAINSDARFRYYFLPQESVIAARAYGIRLAQGAFVGFVDSDDFVSPQMFESLVSLIRATGCDFVSCESFRFDGREDPNEVLSSIDFSKTKSRIFKSRAFVKAKKRIRFHSSLGLYTKLIKADLAKRVAFFYERDLSIRAWEDALFIYPLFFLAKNWAHVNAPLYGYYRNPKSLSHTLLLDKAYFEDCLAVTKGLLFASNEIKGYSQQCYIYALFGAISFLMNQVYKDYETFHSCFSRERIQMCTTFNIRRMPCIYKEFGISELLLAFSLKFNHPLLAWRVWQKAKKRQGPISKTQEKA